MRDTDYAYAVAYTRTLENKMLKKSDYEALLAMQSATEALHYLLDRGYGGDAGSGQSPDAEMLLKEEMAYIWQEVRNACPKGAPIDVLLYQNDFHNLKTALKAVLGGAYDEALTLEPYTVSPDVFHRAVAEGRPETLPGVFGMPASEAYHILAREGDGRAAEVVLDKALYSAMSEAARLSKSEFLMGWVDLCIAVMNMKVAVRGLHGGKDKEFLRGSMLGCRRIDADSLADAAARDISSVMRVFEKSGFGEAASMAQGPAGAFDKCCDNELVKYLKPARYMILGFAPILGFLAAKQFELQAVRIILSGLGSRVPAGVIRERLRDTYV